MISPNAHNLTACPVSDFLHHLVTTGDVIVPTLEAVPVVFDDYCRSIMIERDAEIRESLGLSLPSLRSDATEWAALLFFQACQFVVCREVSEAAITRMLTVACPGLRDASTEYSVDLVFQFLPDLHNIASRLSPQDPLVIVLSRLARDWPLSSVGIVLDPPPEIAFESNAALLRLYADRVTERAARDRLNSAALRQLLQADAGLVPNLLPFPVSIYSHG